MDCRAIFPFSGPFFPHFPGEAKDRSKVESRKIQIATPNFSMLNRDVALARLEWHDSESPDSRFRIADAVPKVQTFLSKLVHFECKFPCGSSELSVPDEIGLPIER